MISYIFTENEMKLLCGLMKLEILSVHQFSDRKLTEDEYSQALESLQRKSFVTVHGGDAEINSGIYIMLDEMNNAEKIYRNTGETIFTAYICKYMSLLLIHRSNRLMLYPFENENLLDEWLKENEILHYEVIKLRRSELNG